MRPENVIILDSCALMAYLGAQSGWERLKEIFAQAQEGICSLQLCVINLGETLYMTERRRGLDKAQHVQALIAGLPIEIIDAARDLVLEAAHIKANHPLSYAGAFVVALAQRKAGTVLTGDPEFQSASELVAIEWLN